MASSYYVNLSMIIWNLKVMVCGSIGYGGVDEIRRLYKVLKEKKYGIVDHLVEKGMIIQTLMILEIKKIFVAK